MISSKLPRVVIVGAGFGGLQAVRTLAGSGVEVVLVDRNNYHTFSPLLHQVATAELEPQQVAYPIRNVVRNLPNTRFCMAEVTGINLDKQLLETSRYPIPYDFLIVGTGSTSVLTGVPGAAEYAFPLKTVPEAIALRNHIFRCFEQAAPEVDPRRCEQLLTFAVVGGGATGVEFVGSLAELVNDVVAKDYPSLAKKQVRIVLLHSGDRLLKHLKSDLSNYTQNHLHKLGVEVRLQTKVTQVTPDAVQLEDGRSIATATVIWATGVQANLPTGWELPTTNNGKVAVSSFLSVPGYPNAYVIGDIADFAQNGEPLPMVVPVAIAQGKAVARNIRRQMQRRKPIPFHYYDKGSMAIISRHAAVAQMGKLSLQGFPAWLLWLGFHLAMLTGIRPRLLTLINWLWNYFLQDRVARLILTPSFVSTREGKLNSVEALASGDSPKTW